MNVPNVLKLTFCIFDSCVGLWSFTVFYVYGCFILLCSFSTFFFVCLFVCWVFLLLLQLFLCKYLGYFPCFVKSEIKIMKDKKKEDTSRIYKEMIFSSDVFCKTCLKELQKQEKIDEYMHSKRLIKDTIRELSLNYIEDGINNRTGEVTESVIDNTYYSVKF